MTRNLSLLTMLIIFSLAWPLAGAAAAPMGVDYYVAVSGSDAAPGTLTQPFETIQKCAEVAQAGDTCFIRGGTYRETVTPTHSGTAAEPITFTAYQDELVILSGADPIAGPWTSYDGAVYQASMPWDVSERNPDEDRVISNQVFVDGRPMVPARWPNVPVDKYPVLHVDDHAAADSAANISAHAAAYLDSDLAVFGSDDWAGGKISFAPGYGFQWTTCDVDHSSSSQIDLTCNPDPATWGDVRSDLLSAGDMLKPSAMNHYYLWGKMLALDAPGEWFRDDAAQTLYLILPDGGNDPGSHLVEARKRLWAFDFSDLSYINVTGLRLFAAGIHTNHNSGHLTFDRIHGEYLWHLEELPPLNSGGGDAIELYGSYNTLSNSELYYTSGVMLSLRQWSYPDTTGNLIENNVIMGADTMGYSAGINGIVDYDKFDLAQPHTITQNTVFLTGRMAIQAESRFDITYNDAYESHQMIYDLGTIYTWGTDGKGAHIAYNLVHDNYATHDSTYKFWGGHGIYLDDDARNYHVYRNIVWNTTSPGFFSYGVEDTITGWYNVIYHNTIEGDLAADYKPSWNQVQDGAVFKNNIGTVVDLNGPGLAQADNFEGNPLYADADQQDYSLLFYSPVIDTVPDLGSPYTDPPMAPIGTPDQGALEYGQTPFVAGALILPEDAASLDAVCWQTAEGDVDCEIGNLPMGRKLPEGFGVRIGTGGAWGSDCRTVMNYVHGYPPDLTADPPPHHGVGVCLALSDNGLSGVQPIYLQYPGESWVDSGETIDLGGLAVFTVTPALGPESGGTPITLSGRLFDTSPGAWVQEVTLSNAGAVALFDYQVQVVVDTAALISAGKLDAACQAMSFQDADGADLYYTVLQGCGTSTTRLWVRMPYVPSGDSTLWLYTSPSGTSDHQDFEKTFVFTETFDDPDHYDTYWTTSTYSDVTVGLLGGDLQIVGETTAGTVYDMYGPYLNLWKLNLPDDFAMDARLTIPEGPASFKMTVGGALSLYGDTVPKTIGYYAGDWHALGTSTINTGQPVDVLLSMAYAGPVDDRTFYWFENGDLTSPRVTWANQNDPDVGGFMYGPDDVTAFDVRLGAVWIRKFAYPEPTAAVGASTPSGLAVTLDGLPCTGLRVSSPIEALCFTPPHAPGPVDVLVENPNGTQAVLAGGFTYQGMDAIYLPLVVMDE